MWVFVLWGYITFNYEGGQSREDTQVLYCLTIFTKWDGEALRSRSFQEQPSTLFSSDFWKRKHPMTLTIKHQSKRRKIQSVVQTIDLCDAT